jgi:hypothetical protein
MVVADLAAEAPGFFWRRWRKPMSARPAADHRGSTGPFGVFVSGQPGVDHNQMGAHGAVLVLMDSHELADGQSCRED